MSFGRTSVDDCDIRPDSPEKLFCDRTAPWTNETYVKLAGAYPLPWGLSASGTFQNLPGTLYQANVVFTNSQIAPSLGRNLSACGAAAVCAATRTITVTEPGSLAEGRLNQFDFRLAKTIQLGRIRFKPAFDAYNVFNASTILRVNNTYNARWPQPTDLLGGRLFKFGADVEF